MNNRDSTIAQRARAVRAFDAVYGGMDRTLWTFSQACRPWLLRGEHSPILDDFVWTLKSWWGLQGVRSETKHAMGAALAGLDWTREDFEETFLPAGQAESFAYDVVRSLVSKSME